MEESNIVVALHKKGAFSDAGNYRPISLTCILCKVYEKLLSKHLYNHVKEYINLNQHGFVEGKSCLSNPYGFWNLSQEIFNRIPDNSAHINYLREHPEVAMRRHISI